MALRIPTTQEVTDRNLTNLESNLNQTSPLAEKAFLRVLAAMEAMNYTELNRFLAERTLQNFALTATGDDLDRIGEEYEVIRKPAIATELYITIDGVIGTTIPISTVWILDSNNVKYETKETVILDAVQEDILVVCQEPGVIGNVSPGESLTIENDIVDLESDAVTAATTVIGTDRETDDSYRRRILNEIRTVGGGGNSTDYRTWAEQTPGVFRAFPYAGAPITDIPNFEDGNMDAATTTAWTAGNSATLSKVSGSQYEGSRNLKIAYNAVADPYAYQGVLTTGNRYRVAGVARSDGTYKPYIANPDGTKIWEGTTSTSWQDFDVSFIAVEVNMSFYGDCSAAGFVEFDAVTLVQDSLPGDRSVFIEADSTLDPDGIASQDLLDDARDYINFDPDTGKARPPLGETDETLWVESIRRTSMFVEIRDLVVPSEVEASTKTSLETAVDEYFRAIVPYIEGLDPPIIRNDIITNLTLSTIVQSVLTPVGGTAGGVGFGPVADEFVPSYILGQGELTKSGGVTYV
jgi:hypothetical protein